MMNYIDNDDYWARQWQLEAESEAHFIEQQRIEDQNAAGIDLPFLGPFFPQEFSNCVSFTEEVPF